MGIMDNTFEQHRNLLFTLAYDILGSVHDAEDVVQETWLAWAAVEVGRLDHPRAYLARIAVRQALARARRLRAAREDYVGPWLPAPLLTGSDPSETTARAEELTFGLLVVLETLSPLERAAFVLREGFGYEHTRSPAFWSGPLRRPGSWCIVPASTSRRGGRDFPRTPASHAVPPNAFWPPRSVAISVI